MPNVPPKRKPFVWKLPVETPALSKYCRIGAVR